MMGNTLNIEKETDGETIKGTHIYLVHSAFIVTTHWRESWFTKIILNFLETIGYTIFNAKFHPLYPEVSKKSTL